MKHSEIKTKEISSWQVGLFSNKQFFQWILCLVTFIFIFILHTRPLTSSDIWWHMNAGRWIWTNGGMPTDDPFLFSSTSPLDARASLILRGYPLSQLLFFGFYNFAGVYALITLQSLLITLFYGLLWNYFRQLKLHPLLASTIVVVLPVLFFDLVELRPQWFSFIGTLLVMQLIEYTLANERKGRPLKKYILLFLPATMLLWANLHPGYVIGIGLIIVYIFSEWIARKKGIAALSNDAYRRFLTVAIISVLITVLNPAGISATWVSFTGIFDPFSQAIDEYLGPLKYFDHYGEKHIGYIIVAVAAIPSLALLLKWRELSTAHLLLLVIFLSAGILSYRFSLLMVMVVLVIFCIYYAYAVNRWLSVAKGIPMILWCASILVLANSALLNTCLFKSPLDPAIPSAAADYLEQAKPAGNIYNYYGYGGYLSWRLYPQKIYTDQRCLSWDTYREYTDVREGFRNYQEVFDKSKIGVVILPILDFVTGEQSQLVIRLLHNDAWPIVYYDKLFIVFVRHSINSHLSFLDKKIIAQDILNSAGSGSELSPPPKQEVNKSKAEDTLAKLQREAEAGNANAQNSLGWIYSGGHGATQNYREAVKWYRLAAVQGNASAQLALGKMYGIGQGVAQDQVRAQMWLNFAAAKGNSEAQQLLDMAAKHMTPVQIAEVKKKALDCERSNYNKCD